MQCHVPPMSTTPIGENLTFDHFNRPGSKLKGLSHGSLVHFVNTVEPRFSQPLYNKVLDIMNNFLYPNNSKIYEKEPRYNKTSLW